MNALNLNEVIIAGILSDKPAKRVTQTGKTVTNGSILVTKTYTYNGETVESKIYVNITAFGDIADALTYTPKGTNIIVTGELAVRTSNDESKTKYSSPKYYVIVRTLSKADESLIGKTTQQHQLVDNSALF